MKLFDVNFVCSGVYGEGFFSGLEYAYEKLKKKKIKEDKK